MYKGKNSKVAAQGFSKEGRTAPPAVAKETLEAPEQTNLREDYWKDLEGREYFDLHIGGKRLEDYHTALLAKNVHVSRDVIEMSQVSKLSLEKDAKEVTLVFVPIPKGLGMELAIQATTQSALEAGFVLCPPEVGLALATAENIKEYEQYLNLFIMMEPIQAGDKKRQFVNSFIDGVRQIVAIGVGHRGDYTRDVRNRLVFCMPH